MQKLLEATRAVDGSGIIQLGIHAGQSRQINNGAPANLLPNVGQHIDGAIECRVLQKRAALTAEKDNDVIEQTACHRKVGNHADDDNQRDEVGQIGQRLNTLFKTLMMDFVDEQRQNDGCREAEQQQLKAQQQRVADKTPKERACEKAGKIVQADPRTTEKSQCRLVVFECDQRTVHRLILEQNKIHQHGDDNDV